MLPMGKLVEWIRRNWNTIQKAREEFDGKEKRGVSRTASSGRSPK
jgi:hypothetical protein